MKRTPLMLFVVFLGAGCGLDTAGLGDRSHQPGSTATQHTDAGANVGPGADASSPVLVADAGTEAAAAVDAAVTGCSAASCSGGDVCCAQDLGGGQIETSCAPSCGGDSAVVCDPSGPACADGDCTTTGKLPSLYVCH